MKITLKVYDILGRDVITLLNEEQNAGYHEVNFNASGYPSGMYLYRINAISIDGKISSQAKMMTMIK
jgi:hypothetical protein